MMPPGETETIVPEEIVRRIRCAVASQIRRRRTQDPASHRNLACNHPRIIGKAEPENEIEAVRLIFQTCIGEHKMRLESGMLGREERENGSEMPAAEIGGCANFEQPASRASSRGNLGFRVADLLENGTTSLIEQQAFISQAEAA